jgi:hypothetical protein
MRAFLLQAVGCAVLVAGCSEASPLDASASKTTLKMQAAADGKLQYCNAAGTCQSLPNPDGCAVLTVTIDQVKGGTCESCVDAKGGVLRDSCADTSVACTVVTLPEPDCVICAYVNGAIIYSSCVAEQPQNCVTQGGSVGGSGGVATAPAPSATCTRAQDCPRGAACQNGLCASATSGASTTTTAPPSAQPCKVCYDAAGKVVLDECLANCTNTVCPAVACAKGFKLTSRPGECCPQCAPEQSCSNVMCPMIASVPACPPGTAAQRDPNDCCGLVCLPVSCDVVDCVPVPKDCPAGFTFDSSFPNCCGACIPAAQARYCMSDTECQAGEVCTTDQGECLAPPDCKEAACPAVCYGLCRPTNWTCPAGAPNPTACAGKWDFPGRDAFGCPLPPVCLCPDGTVSADGQCVDACATVRCSAAPPTCESGFHLEMRYPYCCGACVPDDQCWTQPPACKDDGGCLPTEVCANGQCMPASNANPAAPAIACPAVACAAGQHAEPGPGCCPLCVPDPTPCTGGSECATGFECSTKYGDCKSAPGCDPSSSACVSVCYGICVRAPSTGTSNGQQP